MRARIKIKAAAIFAGIVLALVLLFAGVQYLESRRGPGAAARTGQEELAKSRFSRREDAAGQKEQHKISLYGREYFYTDDIETYLFIGVDESGNAQAEGDAYRGEMADMLLVAVVNHTDETYSVLQLNRDTITEVQLMDHSGGGNASADLQLCTAHWYGGNAQQSCENTKQAVSSLLGGIEIDAYYSLAREAIQTLNHEVGGVSVTVKGDFSKVDASLAEGETVTLTDKQAYTYLCTRYGVDDGENLSRMERHRQYLTALAGRIREKTDEDDLFPIRLYEKLSDDMVTNVTGKQISRLAKELEDYDNLGIYTIEGTTAIGSRLGDGREHMEFYLDEDSQVAVERELFGLTGL